MAKRVSSEDDKEVIQEKINQNTSGSTTYNTGKWTEDEHDRFLKAIKIHGNLWKKVRDCVGTRSCAQIRSHCQKYFRRKRNMKLQELRRTNRLKGMVFLVIEEYYNYAASTTKHGDVTNFFEAKSIKTEEEDRKETPEHDLGKQAEYTPVHESELVGFKDPADEEPIDLSFGTERVEIFVNEETLSNEPNRYETEYQLNGAGLYEPDSEMNVSFHNQYY